MYILRVEFIWGKLFTKVMGNGAINTGWIHDRTVWTTIKVADEVIDPLEGWCRCDRNLGGETVDSIHQIRGGVCHNM